MSKEYNCYICENIFDDEPDNQDDNRPICNECRALEDENFMDEDVDEY